MKYKYHNGEDVFETNVSLFEEEIYDGGDIFVDYDSNRFRLVLNHFRKVGHVVFLSLEYDLNRMEEAIGCESRTVIVGGKSFQLGMGTFEKIPFLKGKTSFEDLNGIKESKEVDMDPVIFQRIVSYLRNPKCHSLTEEMKVEMNYYGIKLPEHNLDHQKILEKNTLNQIITFQNYQERKVTNWTEQHFQGRPDFGKRICCSLYPHEALESIVYLSVVICLGRLLEVDQIINRIEFEIRGYRVNYLFGKIMKINQLAGLTPPMITRQEPDCEFYLIPINLMGGENSWIDYPLMDKIQLIVEFNYNNDTTHCSMDHASLFINYRTGYLHQKKSVDQITDLFLLEAKNVKEIPYQSFEYDGPEYVMGGCKYMMTIHFPGEIDGIFLMFEPTEDKSTFQTSDLSGHIKFGQTKHFDRTTNILEQTTKFGSFCPEFFYIHLEINLNRIDPPILELNKIAQEGQIYCWTYRKNHLPIACDEKGVAQTIANIAFKRSLNFLF